MAYRVVFCGTPSFAVPTLTALYANRDFTVEKVFSQPDRPSGRGKKLKASPVKQTALEFNIPVETPERASASEVVQSLQKEKYDIGVVVAYGQLLSQDFLDSFKYGCVNIHSSLLPRWRGAAPMQRAIMAGDPITGVALQKVVKKLDAGPIIATKEVDLPLEMGATELFELLSQVGAKLLDSQLKLFLDGEIQLQEQDESQVTYAKKIAKEEGAIDWNRSAEEIHNKIRALDMGGPYAFTTWNGKSLKIHQSFPEQGESKPAGEITQVEKEFFYVACGKGRLRVLTVQPESKAKMTAADFIRGYHLEQGDHFE